MNNADCKGCEYCGSAYAQDGFKILTCKYPPYKGRWIAELPICPWEVQKGMADLSVTLLKGKTP